MVRTVLEAIAPAGSVKHVALVTGLKHYLGPFEAYAKGGVMPADPLARGTGAARSAELLLQSGGRALRGVETRRLHLERASPPYDHRQGHRQRHEHGHDARRLCVDLQGDRPARSSSRERGAMERALRHDRRARARQAARLGEHARTPPRTRRSTSSTATSFAGAGCGRASPNGSASTWEGFDGAPVPLEGQMAEDADVWKAMAAKYDLVEPDLWRVASPWHTDLDLGRPIEVMTDMAQSRKLGFPRLPEHRRGVPRPVCDVAQRRRSSPDRSASRRRERRHPAATRDDIADGRRCQNFPLDKR